MGARQLPAAEQYRETAKEIRRLAQRTRSPGVRDELLDLAARYERMAARASRGNIDWASRSVK
jgi:hypothetical protein